MGTKSSFFGLTEKSPKYIQRNVNMQTSPSLKASRVSIKHTKENRKYKIKVKSLWKWFENPPGYIWQSPKSVNNHLMCDKKSSFYWCSTNRKIIIKRNEEKPRILLIFILFLWWFIDDCYRNATQHNMQNRLKLIQMFI